MTYTIIVPKAVQKQLDSLPKAIYDRIAVKIAKLSEEPRPAGAIKMKGTDCEYRIRIGDYRVRYEIDDEKLILLLLKCQHRREVYRK